MVKSKVKKEIALERDHNCTGCGTTQHLSHSHYIPISKRKDLENNKKNITYHCLSVGKKGCHDKWESNDYKTMVTLNDFTEAMEAVKRLDRLHYNFLMSRFSEQGFKKAGLL